MQCSEAASQWRAADGERGEIPLQLIKDHSACACKCEEANLFCVSGRVPSRDNSDIFKGGNDSALSLFPESGLSVSFSEPAAVFSSK